MATEPIGVGIIGCGVIAADYVADLATYPMLELIGATDIDQAKTEALIGKAGCRGYESTEALLADDRIDIVLNLTIHHAHKAVIQQALEAGKHVFSEKPLAMSYEEARDLVDLAERKQLRLGGAPFTFMGEAQQTAAKWVREGRLGPIRLAYAEANWGRIEAWHPAPQPFYEVGPLFDVGVYPLSILTAIFGPARRVRAYGHVLQSDRVTKRGVPYQIETPDFVVALIELEDGPLVRLTTNFYVTQQTKQAGIEFHGDGASLTLDSWIRFDAAVAFAPFNEPFEPVPLLREPDRGVRWGRAVNDMAEAIMEGRAHRATGRHAAHVVEILSAAKTSMESGRPVTVHSTFDPPAPMPWAVTSDEFTPRYS